MKEIYTIVAIVTIGILLSFGCAKSYKRHPSAASSGSGDAIASATDGDTEDETVDEGDRSLEIPCPDNASEDLLIIESKAELEKLSNCITLKDVFIRGSAITDLRALSNVKTITGSLIVENTELTDLQGLNNLTEIGEELFIGTPPLPNNKNTPLETLDGLNNLRTIGKYMAIDGNASLTDITALSNLESIGGNLKSIADNLAIRDNPSLPTCDAFAFAERLGFDPTENFSEICGNKRGDSCDWIECIRGL